MVSGKLSNKKVVQHFLQGDNAENDYRLIKQSDIFSNHGYFVEIQHFHVHNNSRDTKEISQRIKICSRKLLTRKYFKLGKLTFVKLIEQWLQIFFIVLKTRPKGVILHDERLFGAVILLGILKKLNYINFLYWDLRELPEDLIRSKFSIFLLKIAIILTDYTISASALRARFLRLFLKLKNLTFLENYPEENFGKQEILSEKYNLPNEYVYLQSPSEPDRFLHNILSALINNTSFKIVITGRLNQADNEYVMAHYNKHLGARIQVLGLIPTNDLAHVMRGAKFSIVLYKADKLNRRLCAPNRLFQSLVVGTPMLLGNNLSMLHINKRFNAGICLNSDGSDFDDLVSHMCQIEKGQLVFERIDSEAILKEVTNHDWKNILLPHSP